MTIDLSAPDQHTRNFAGASTGRGSKEGNEISLLGRLIALAERNRLLMAVTAGVVYIALAVSPLLPVLFTATCRMLPPHLNSSMSASHATQLRICAV
jgi:uncharacterized protein involved in exopolysaccharide biosynthesis